MGLKEKGEALLTEQFLQDCVDNSEGRARLAEANNSDATAKLAWQDYMFACYALAHLKQRSAINQAISLLTQAALREDFEVDADEFLAVADALNTGAKVAKHTSDREMMDQVWIRLAEMLGKDPADELYMEELLKQMAERLHNGAQAEASLLQAQQVYCEEHPEFAEELDGSGDVVYPWDHIEPPRFPLCIVFDKMPCPDGATFIDVHDHQDKGIDAGIWRARPDGLAELVLHDYVKVIVHAPGVAGCAGQVETISEPQRKE